MIAARSVLYQHDASTGVATVTLNRPERYNALTFEVYDELKSVFDALDVEPGVRAIVLTGAGKAFCTGGDVEDIIGALFGRDYRGLLDFTRRTGALILAMLRCRRPIVGALNGQVAGAGVVIAAACDLRVASRTRGSPTSSPRSACPAPTWAPPGSCRGSSAMAGRPSC